MPSREARDRSFLRGLVACRSASQRLLLPRRGSRYDIDRNIRPGGSRSGQGSETGLRAVFNELIHSIRRQQIEHHTQWARWPVLEHLASSRGARFRRRVLQRDRGEVGCCGQNLPQRSANDAELPLNSRPPRIQPDVVTKLLCRSRRWMARPGASFRAGARVQKGCAGKER
jgi:hypothetical protein